MVRTRDRVRLQRFEEEALPHMRALFNTALRMTRNRDDAADLVQETYLKAFRAFDGYEPGTNCKAWLFKILTNTGINAYVKRSKQPPRVDFEVAEPFLRAPESQTAFAVSSTDLGALANLVDDEVREALEAVPVEFRVVLILSVIEGFAYKEIATILEIPIGTVMSRLFRGRKLLQSKLYEYGQKRGLVRDEPRGEVKRDRTGPGSR